MNTNKRVFEDMSVPKAVATMAIPSMVSMLVVILYNMADTFFIGQTGDSLQVAAVSLATPVFLVLMALGNLFGIGGSSAVSRALGEKNEKRAKNISAFCCYGCLGLGIIMGVVFLAGNSVIMKLIGADESTIGFASDYMRYVSYGAPFVMFSAACGNLIRGEGAARQSMVGNMIGTVTNIVLDPIMILAMDMGVAGAAIATVIGNVAASVYYLIYFLRKKTVLSFSIKDFTMGAGIPLAVFAIGVPASLNNILMSISNIIFNNILVAYGNTQVAAMGVAMKANMLVIMLQIGLCTGIQPLVGYNYGSGNSKRLKKVFSFTAMWAVVMGTVLTAVMIMLREPILKVFIDDSEVIQAGVKMMLALQIPCPVIGILFLCINTIQGMGKALPSLILTVCRQGIVFIPMVYILNALFQLDGVIYAQATADFVSIGLALAICMSIIRKMDKKKAGAPETL